MDSIIETFHIDWKVIIAQALNFGIVFVVLYVYALKPLSKLMKERSERIDKGLEDAKTNNEMLKQTTLKYDEAMAQVKIEASNIFTQGKKEAEAERQRMVEEAKKEAENIVSAGKKSLEAEKEKMVQEAKNEIATIAMLAAEKIMKEKK